MDIDPTDLQNDIDLRAEENQHEQANNRSIFYGNRTATPTEEILKKRASTAEGN